MQNATDPRKTLTQEARAILGGLSKSPQEILDLAKELAKLNEFEFARRILEKAYEKSNRADNENLHQEIIQKRALYTYKDGGLRKEERLERARNILAKDEALSKTTDQETLGLAGAIYKRRWEVNNDKLDLALALSYYGKGYDQGTAKDKGYTGINAAFLQDLLAYQEEREAAAVGGTADDAPVRRKQAQEIRKEITGVVPALMDADPKLKQDWWVYATIGEAYFGLGQYDKAVEWLVSKPKAAALTVARWERDSTARQVASLALMQSAAATEADFLVSPVGNALTDFLGNRYVVGRIYRQKDDALRSGLARRFGLGLSGGGFRASLFHIGVLARLAELDLLRSVEVFSCVSGGSIIGAHYYLALREMLQTRSDSQITQQDYIDIIKDIEREFLLGVQQNIRTRALAEITTNLKRLVLGSYSRTHRVGDLYESEIFSRIEKDQEKRKQRRRQKLWVSDLPIVPLGEGGQAEVGFEPGSGNWLRENKVPVLILNAATLNTGHSWHFTALKMGEPTPLWDSGIETIYRLPDIKYQDAERSRSKVRLGHAVAASSCVPGLFEPIEFDNLYKGKSVLLVDGGVCDNQGAQGLLQNDCDVILVSDASGQIGALDVPGSGMVGVLGRSAGISQARVREAQYYDLKARKRSSMLRELLFLHLKQELNVTGVEVIGDALYSTQGDAPTHDRTGYGVATDIQELLAGIRTDLDSFCDAEAYALMASAYLMTRQALEGSEYFKQAGPEVRGDWEFLKIAGNMEPEGEKKAELKYLLKACGSRTLKSWKVTKPLKWAGIVIAFALLAALVAACFFLPARRVFPAGLGAGFTTKALGWVAAVVLGVSLVTFVIGKVSEGAGTWVKRQKQSVLYRLIAAVLLFGGFLIARLHLWTFDKLFLWLGRLDRFKS